MEEKIYHAEMTYPWGWEVGAIRKVVDRSGEYGFRVTRIVADGWRVVDWSQTARPDMPTIPGGYAIYGVAVDTAGMVWNADKQTLE